MTRYLVLLRGEPSVASDQGVFLSVAARILDGDHLYSEVVDNKDPLFFYTYAGALWVGGWRGPFLLDAIWVGLAGVSVALLARAIGAPRSTRSMCSTGMSIPDLIRPVIRLH